MYVCVCVCVRVCVCIKPLCITEVLKINLSLEIFGTEQAYIVLYFFVKVVSTVVCFNNRVAYVGYINSVS